MARGDLQVGRPLEHNDRDGGSLAEADGQRNRASVALGSPGECALRWANVLSLDAGVGCSFSAGAAVALSDNEEWSLYGAPWLQPVATGRKSLARENGSIKPRPLPPAAASCRLKRMVRRGSTVRVRQRA
jgi:hypothetical protein